MAESSTGTNKLSPWRTLYEAPNFWALVSAVASVPLTLLGANPFGPAIFLCFSATWVGSAIKEERMRRHRSDRVTMMYAIFMILFGIVLMLELVGIAIARKPDGKVPNLVECGVAAVGAVLTIQRFRKIRGPKTIPLESRAKA